MFLFLWFSLSRDKIVSESMTGSIKEYFFENYEFLVLYVFISKVQ